MASAQKDDSCGFKNPEYPRIPPLTQFVSRGMSDVIAEVGARHTSWCWCWRRCWCGCELGRHGRGGRRAVWWQALLPLTSLPTHVKRSCVKNVCSSTVSGLRVFQRPWAGPSVGRAVLIPTVRRARSSPLASTRILGRRTAPFPPFLIPNRVPRGVYPNILVLTARHGGPGELALRPSSTRILG